MKKTINVYQDRLGNDEVSNLEDAKQTIIDRIKDEFAIDVRDDDNEEIESECLSIDTVTITYKNTY